MSTQKYLTLVALQIEPSQNLTDTFMQIRKLVQTASSEYKAIDCIVLPEYAFGTFREWVTMKHNNEELTNAIQTGIANLVKQYKVPILAGTIPFLTEKNQWRNRAYLFSAIGEIVGTYDKQHPFRSEKQLGLEPGTEMPLHQLGNLRLAILICSDLWHHESISPIAEKADFIAVPTMTTVLDPSHINYGQWTWQSLVAIRAKEYTVPIVSADQAVREYAPGIFTCGASCIADPSYRFSNEEDPSRQALKVAPNKASNIIVSKISTQALHEYRIYRREVGLHK